MLWLIGGLIIGFAIFWINSWASKKNASLKWYEWIISIIGFMLLLLGIQTYFGSIAESETTAAYWSLLSFGLTGLILLLVAGLLATRRMKAA